MSYIYTYLEVAKKLIGEYEPPQPFHLYLKKYFSQNKKHGSRDRKTIAALCYSYYRTGKNFIELPIENKILIGLVLSQPNLLNTAWIEKLNELFPKLSNNFIELDLDNKLKELQQHYSFTHSKLFETNKELPIEASQYSVSLLKQPYVWLRAKKNKKEKVEESLSNAGIETINHPEVSNAIGLTKPINLEQVLGKNHHHLVEVQDASSQATGSYITVNPNEKVWDCCCGAGGKSLMLKDIEPKIELYCSDIRPQIIQNLKERFKLSGVASPFEVALDITHNHTNEILFETKSERKTASLNYFDTIVADVPCTGSGTWARTPEQAFYFNDSEVDNYANRQKNIVSKAIPFLKKGGKLYYITCSVFKKENEEQLSYFETLGLRVNNQQLINGSAHFADSMFIAELEKLTQS